MPKAFHAAGRKISASSTLCILMGIRSIEPVSYTHLDVYKRQALSTHTSVPALGFIVLPAVVKPASASVLPLVVIAVYLGTPVGVALVMWILSLIHI